VVIETPVCQVRGVTQVGAWSAGVCALSRSRQSRCPILGGNSYRAAAGHQVSPGPHPLLILDWQDRRITLDAHRGTVVCGSRPDVDLHVRRQYVSRRHGRIERRGDSFVLVDESANGTFVQTEDERVLFVRRGELRLWGAGWISFGEPPTNASVVRFRHD